MFDKVGSKSTLSCDVPFALSCTAPFSAASPLSGDDGSYIFVRTGFGAGGAAGGGAGGGGSDFPPPKHMILFS
jgi:hypothetical protein